MFDFLPRILFHYIRSLFKSKVTILDSFSTSFRTWPVLDTDGFRMMSAPRYLALAAVVAWAHTLRSQWFRYALKNKWIFVTRRQFTEFYKPIKILSRVEVTTKLLAWDEHSFLRRVEFYQNGELRARTYLQIFTISTGRRKVTTEEVFHKSGMAGAVADKWPEEIKTWVSKF